MKAESNQRNFVRAFARAIGGVKSFPLSKRPDVTEMQGTCFTKRIKQECPLLGQSEYSDACCNNCVLLKR